MSKIEIPAGLQSKLCELGEGVIFEVPAIVKELWGNRQVIVVADGNTWEVAGKQVQELLKQAGLPVQEPVIFPGKPILEPDYKNVQKLIPILQGKVPVAVGSGVINDLVKCAATEANCDGYLVVGTACSVDGYTSYGAALQVDGFKKTVPCAAPLAIVADAQVLSTAPAQMTASGYADLMAKIVSGGDWHIADILGEAPINPTAWQMTQVKLRQWLGDPEGIATVKPSALTGLFEGLAATGFAMQLMHDSRPASGAEHLISHIMEMDGVMFNGEHPSHGFKVGIGTLLSCAMMHQIFSMSKEEVAKICAAAPFVTPEQRKTEIDKYLKDSTIYEQVNQVCMQKLLDQQRFQKRMQDIVAHWDEMKQRVLNQIFTLEETRRRLKVVGCPTRPCEIGADHAEIRRAVICSQMIRNRYTVFDLAYEMGIFEQAVDQILPLVE